MTHKEYIKRRVANASTLRKPDPRVVAYDKDGRWIFEVYAPKETKVLCR